MGKDSTAWDSVPNKDLDLDIPVPEVPEEVDTARDTYYDQNRAELAGRARDRWHNNVGGYRDRGLARAQDKRALARAKVADGKFEKRQKKMLKASPRTKRPRLTQVDDDPSAEEDGGVWVWSSGVLAIGCGKSPPTMRTWIEERVIPGCSIIMGDRYWFSAPMMDAIAEGILRTLYVDGRCPHNKLRRYIAAEIEAREVPLAPFPS